MNVSDLPNELRMPADRIESAGFEPKTDEKIELSAHGIESRGELAAWAHFMGNPNLLSVSGHPYLKLYGWRPEAKFEITAWFKPEILPGKTVAMYEPDAEALAALMAASSWPLGEPAVAQRSGAASV